MTMKQDVEVLVTSSKQYNERFRHAIVEIDKCLKDSTMSLARSRERLAKLTGVRQMATS